VAPATIVFPGWDLAVIAEFNETDMWLYEWAADGSVTETNLTMDRSDLEEGLQAPDGPPMGRCSPTPPIRPAARTISI